MLSTSNGIDGLCSVLCTLTLALFLFSSTGSPAIYLFILSMQKNNHKQFCALQRNSSNVPHNLLFSFLPSFSLSLSLFPEKLCRTNWCQYHAVHSSMVCNRVLAPARPSVCGWAIIVSWKQCKITRHNARR